MLLGVACEQHGPKPTYIDDRVIAKLHGPLYADVQLGKSSLAPEHVIGRTRVQVLGTVVLILLPTKVHFRVHLVQCNVSGHAVRDPRQCACLGHQ